MIHSKETRTLSTSALVVCNYGATQTDVIEVRGDEFCSTSILNFSIKNQGDLPLLNSQVPIHAQHSSKGQVGSQATERNHEPPQKYETNSLSFALAFSCMTSDDYA